MSQHPVYRKSIAEAVLPSISQQRHHSPQEPWLWQLPQQPDPILTNLVMLAGQIGAASAAILTLTDGEQRWCQASYNWAGGEDPFWAVATAQPEPIWLNQTALVNLPNIAIAKTVGFYGGVPLLSPNGHLIGLLTVLATATITLTQPQRQGLQTLAQQIVNHLELQAYRTGGETLPRQPQACAKASSPPCTLANQPTTVDFHQHLQTLAGAERPDLCGVIDSLDDGIVFCDRHRTITVINQSARRLLALETASVNPDSLTQTVTFYIPGNRSPLEPEDLPLWRSLAGETLRDLEMVLVQPQGERYMVLVNSRPLWGPDEQILGAMMSFYDITQRYRAETALRASNQGLKTKAQQRLEDLKTINQQLQQESMQRQQAEATLRLFYDLPFLGMAIISSATKSWLHFNDRLCEILGYYRDELQQTTWAKLIHPDDLPQSLALLDQLTAKVTDNCTLEARFVRKDNLIVYASLDIKVIFKAEGIADFFVATLQDITERKSVETALMESAQRLRGLHEMDRAILTKFKSQDIAHSALVLLCQLINCPQGIVTLFDREAKTGEVLADSSSDGSDTLMFPAGTFLPLNDLVLAQSLSTPGVKRIQEVALLNPLPPLLQGFSAITVRSAMAIPLLANDVVTGEIMLVSPDPGHFSSDHEEVAQEVANHLAIALQNARLFEQVKHDRARLQALSSQLIEVQETERRFLAHELHDEVGQALTAVKLNLHRLERVATTPESTAPLQDCFHIVEGALQQVRNLSLDLRPSMLDDLGLVPALRWYVHRHAERTGIQETLVCEPPPQGLSAHLETACFRIVQEALTNIARHAQAQTVTVTLEQLEKTLHLSIQDDGVGFDLETVSQAKNKGTSLGILGMEERGMLVGGQLKITSTPGQGACIDLWVPLSPPSLHKRGF